MSERLEECEQCGQIYPPSYGQLHYSNVGAKWYCHDCAQRRADQRKR